MIVVRSDTEPVARGIPAAPAARRDRPVLHALTGLRFFAALLVVLFHFGGPALRALPRPIANIPGAGYVGVSMFYVLSGFVLVYNYANPRGHVAAPRKYAVSRFARVYPVYALALALSAWRVTGWALQKAAAEGATGLVKASVTVASNVLLVQAWLPFTIPQWNSPGWSLSVEAFCYAVFLWLLPRLARRDAGTLLAIAAAAWAAGLAVPLAAYALNFHGASTLTPWTAADMPLEALKMLPILHLPTFVVGCATGQLFLNRSAARRAAGERRGGRLAAAAAVIVLVLLAVSPALPYLPLHNALLIPAFAALIYALAQGGGPIGGLLSWRPIVLLGEASYALYIMHFDLATRFERAWPGVVETPGGLILLVTGCVAVSIATFRFIEEPARRAIRAREARWGRRPLAPAAGVSDCS